MNSSVQYIETYLAELQQIVTQLPVEQVNQVVDILLNNVKSGGKVFMCLRKRVAQDGRMVSRQPPVVRTRHLRGLPPRAPRTVGH